MGTSEEQIRSILSNTNEEPRSDEIILQVKNCENMIYGMKKILCEIKNDAEEVKFGCNVAKTAGTAAGVIGTAAGVGALLAPLTGGLSLIVSCVAMGGGVGGAAVCIGTNFVENFKSKGFIKRIRHQTDGLQCQLDNIDKIMNDFKNLVENIKRDYNCNEQEAQYIARAVFKGRNGCAAFPTGDVKDPFEFLDVESLLKMMGQSGLAVGTSVGLFKMQSLTKFWKKFKSRRRMIFNCSGLHLWSGYPKKFQSAGLYH